MFKRFWPAIWLSVVALALVTGTTFNAKVWADDDFPREKLCLSALRLEGTPGPMFYVGAALGASPTGYWVPGDSHARSLVVSSATTCSHNGAVLDSLQAKIASGYLPMADMMTVAVAVKNSDGTYSQLASAPLGALVQGPILLRDQSGNKLVLPKGGARTLQFTVNFDRSADNSFQGKSLVVDFIVNGVQYSCGSTDDEHESATGALHENEPEGEHGCPEGDTTCVSRDDSLHSDATLLRTSESDDEHGCTDSSVATPALPA